MSDTRHFLQTDNSTANVLKKYEYDFKVIRPAVLANGGAYLDFLKDEFNKLGNQGWEVIQFVTLSQDGTTTLVWVKKMVHMQFAGESQITQVE